MNKKTLWMLLSDISNPQVHMAASTLAWMAKNAGVEFECYLEAPRDGKLFAGTGSTVLGGYHHQQFNYLNSVFNVKYIIFGEAAVFRSSIDVFKADILVETDSLTALYDTLLNMPGTGNPGEIMAVPLMGEIAFLPVTGSRVEVKDIQIGPYLHSEIFFRQALAVPASLAPEAARHFKGYENIRKSYIYLSSQEKKQAAEYVEQAEEIDAIGEGDSYSTITMRIAERWKKRAKGVAFGDPAIILSMLPLLCREERISLYGQLKRKPLSQIKVAWYVEDSSEISTETGKLAEETGNRVIVGRQTGDGDLFEWSKRGVCMKIMDPNRPAFPVIAAVKHKWSVKGNIYEEEPDEETLIRYAKEGKVLATIMWHSGEIAHNEAMLNLFELACLTGVKMGIGVHAARYETCPQLWELLGVPREKGGVKGLIEPVLHSGGLGVMAEVNCPPRLLAEHCKNALKQIAEIAGEENVPKGYLAFMDTDLGTLERGNPQIYEAIASSGLRYVISSAAPGRNRILYDIDGCKVLNQSCRTIMNSSPFIRITTVEDIPGSDNKFKPAWMIGTMDAPVIAFNPYIWRYGSRFMKIVDWLLHGKDVINVTPNVIARYAKVLKDQGFIPEE